MGPYYRAAMRACRCAMLPRMYERRGQPMLTRAEFAGRMALHFAVASAVIAVALGIGTAGYHWTESLGWLDAVLNASMILSGMGPLHAPVTVAGKLFATLYALFSGV